MCYETRANLANGLTPASVRRLRCRAMSYAELEVKTNIVRDGEIRRVWLTALPGMRPGSRVRITSASGEQWWRIVNMGEMRLREATAAIELAS